MNKRFPIVMPIDMAKALKVLALEQDRSVSDIMRTLAAAHLASAMSTPTSSNLRQKV